MMLVISYSFVLVPVERVLHLKPELLVLYYLEQYSKTIRRTTAAIPNQARCLPVLLPLSTRGQHVFICKDFFTSIAAGGRSPV